MNQELRIKKVESSTDLGSRISDLDNISSNKPVKRFTDLIAWQVSHSLVLDIYKATKHFPKDELYGLVSQIRRAAVSITSNIAEGFLRINKKEKIQFYRISAGSAAEVQNQLIISRDLQYIDGLKFNELFRKNEKALQLINGLIKSTSSWASLRDPRSEIRDPSTVNPESRILNPTSTKLKISQPKMEAI